MKAAKAPTAALKYMAEFGGAEPEFRDWLGVQRRAFDALADTSGTDFPRWLQFKMGCSRAGAVSVVKWSGLE